MAKIIEAAELLDSNLPPELRATATATAPNIEFEKNPLEDSTMTTPNTNPVATAAAVTAGQILSPEQVTQLATAAVTTALAADNSQKAVAALVEKHVSDANSARASLATAQNELATAKASVTDLTTKLEAAEAAKKDLQTKKDKAEEEAKDFQAKFKKSKADLDKINTEGAIAKRVAAMTKTGLKLDNFKKKATATNEDGTLKYADADFESDLADYIANAPAAAAAAVVDPATGAAAGAAPVAGAPAAASVEPAPAVTPGTPAAVVPAVAAVVNPNPAAPDLSAVAAYHQASAALANGAAPAVTVAGRAAFASAFPA